MQIIPLQAVPSQTLSITLNGQSVGINLYTLATANNILQVGITADTTDYTADTTLITADNDLSVVEAAGSQALYMDITLDGAPIVTARICASLSPVLLTSQYLGFEGELEFFDVANTTLQTVTNPVYTGLGSQYQLVYFSPADIAAGLGGALPT